MSSLGEKVSHTVQSFVGLTPASPPRQTNNAISPTRTTRRAHSSTESGTISALPVDLTSPTRPSKRAAPPTISESARPPKKKRYSDDEVRLVQGNYGTPADATLVPSPLVWFTKNMAKPGAGSSFTPRNTINQTNSGFGSPRPTTYGNRKLRVNVSFFNDQPSDVPVSTRSRASPAGPNPVGVKRRKLDPSSSPTRPQVIDIDHESDIAEVQTPLSAHARRTPSLKQRPQTSSQRSVGSRYIASARPSHTPRSECEATNLLGDPRRKKARNPAARANPSHKARGVVELGSMHSDPIDLDAEPTQTKFSGFLQGIGHESYGVAAAESPETTSRHFANPKAKMNHSTQPPRGEPSNARPATNPSPTNLRDTFKRSDRTDEVEGTSNAKLEGPSPQPKKWSASQAKSMLKQKTVPGMPTEGWTLNHARAHGFEGRGPGLSLRSGIENSFRVALRVEDMVLTKHDIHLSQVNRAFTDHISRIRLMGPQHADRFQYQVDLEFANPKDLLLFQNNVMRSITQSQLVSKEQVFMSKIFEKLQETSHGRIPRPASDSNTNTRGAPAVKQLKTGLVDALTASVAKKQDRSKPTQNNISTLMENVSFSTRPKRATRAGLPDYTESELEVSKYSIQVGLGPPWERQLNYGSGRRRAVVDFTDLERLDDDEFLNDQLIDFYMLYLFDQMNVSPNRVYIFNTHFFSTLTRKAPGQKSSINYSAVARWTSKEDLFSYDYIVVPINQDVHWYLAIICNVSSISRKPVIEDSKGQSTPQAEAIVAPADVEDSKQKNHKEPRVLTPPPTFAKPEACPPIPNSQDDEILFDLEESDLSLVDAHASRAESDYKNATEYDVSQDSPAVETARMEQLTLHDRIPKSILPNTDSSPTSKRSKRKSGPPAKKWNPDEPTIIILDSLGGGPRSQAVRALKNYLRAEGQEKRGMDAVLTQNAFYAKHTQVPMQENFSDCGVYLLGYAQKFFEDPDRFKNRLLAGDMRTETDWPDMPMPQMRGLMRDLLQRLYQEQEEERNCVKAKKRAKRSTSASKETVSLSRDGTSNAKAAPTKTEIPTEPTPGVPKPSAEIKLIKSEDNSPIPETLKGVLVGPSTGRLGSPFEPKLCMRHATLSQSPVHETPIKVDDSPPPPKRSHQSHGIEDWEWLEGQGERPRAVDLPVVRRSSPQVVIESSKRHLELTRNEMSGAVGTIEVHSPKNLKQSHKPLKASPARAVPKRSPSQHKHTRFSPSKIEKPVPLAVSSVMSSHDPVRCSPGGSLAPGSCGDSQNPIPVDDSQEIVTVSPPKPNKPDVIRAGSSESIITASTASEAQPSPSRQGHLRHASGGENDLRSSVSRGQATSSINGARPVGDTLGSKLRHVRQTDSSRRYLPNALHGNVASRPTVDKDGWEVLSPGSQMLTTQDGPITHDDDTIPETPPERSSPHGVFNGPLPF